MQRSMNAVTWILTMWILLVAAVLLYLLLKELIRLPTVGNYRDRYVFITGCDSGFGNQLAIKLDSLGFNVFAGCFTERGADELRKVSSARLKTVSLDVTKTESILKARENVDKHLPNDKGLWAIVNNAGIMCGVSISEVIAKEDYEKCIAVNLYGTIEVTRIFLPLVRKGQGRIVNMSSLAGRVAVQCPPYAVSKYGVEAFSDCLRREVLHQGVSVHIIEPNAYKTDLTDDTNFRKDLQAKYDASSPEVKRFYGENYVQNVYEDCTKLKTMFSDKTYEVVDSYIHALTARFPRHRHIVGDKAFLMWVLMNLPEWMSDPIFANFTPNWRGSD